jgi:hypothetical protein
LLARHALTTGSLKAVFMIAPCTGQSKERATIRQAEIVDFVPDFRQQDW